MNRFTRRRLQKECPPILPLRLILLLVLLLTASHARAITINPNINNAMAPTNHGGGNLNDIVNAAKEWWESAFGDAANLKLNISWNDLGPGNDTLGDHTLVTQGGTPNRETEGNIRLNKNTDFFFDPTPHDNSEWMASITESTNIFGGGNINIARKFSNPKGNAINRYDLLTVLKHEMGHALGWGCSNTAYSDEITEGVPDDNSIEVTAPRPNAGAVIPTNSTALSCGSHVASSLANALMSTNLAKGNRKVQSAIDILGIAEVSQFAIVDTSPAHVPEPNSGFLLALAGLMLARRRRRILVSGK